MKSSCLFSELAREGREDQEEGQDKIFNGWLNQGMLTAIAWACCPITQSVKSSVLQEELTWDGLFYPSKVYSSGSFCDLGKKKIRFKRIFRVKKIIL